ncbi:MAG TPA: hypothetical protein PLF59_08110 [Cyclobacteriaceae bacterium]|nr:hypothetical protein [Cyclobacteriaceae bacterium]
MTISFEDYCEDYLDLSIALMSEDQLKSARAGYADLVRDSKTPAEIAKHKKALAKAKESRKLAKFYGGKALTGSAAQKKWAEEIRQTVLESSALSDEQKINLVTLGGAANTAKFWINNKDKSPSAFDAATILAEYRKLGDLYNKHYDTLARSNPVHEKEKARKEIYEALSTLTISVTFEFPNCDFYDSYGNLKK